MEKHISGHIFFRAPSTLMPNYNLETSNTQRNKMLNYSFLDSIIGKAAHPLTKANELWKGLHILLDVLPF